MLTRFLFVLFLLYSTFAGAQTQFETGRIDLMEQANQSLRQRQYQTAIGLIDSLQAFTPEREDSLLAYSWHRKGVCYQLLQQWTEAEYAYRQAIGLRQTLFPAGHEDLSLSLFNLGRIYIHQFQYQEAARTLLEAVEMQEELGLTLRKGRSLYYLAEVYEGLKDYRLAADYCIQALAIFQQEEDGEWIARTKLLLGITLEQQGEFPDAIAAYQEALTLNRTLGRTEEVHKAYHNLAIIYEKQGQYGQALALSQEAADFYLANQDSISLGQIYNNIGLIQKKRNLPEAARQSYERALRFLNHTKGGSAHPNWGPALDNLGDLSFEKKAYPEAARYYLQAIQSCLPDYPMGTQTWPVPRITDTTMVQSSQAELLIYLHSLAQTYQKIARQSRPKDSLWAKALAIYRSADALVFKMREEQPSEEGRQQWLNESRKLYQDALDLCFQRNSEADAFYFMERSRATLLLSSLKDAQAKEYAGIPEEKLAREQTLQDSLRSLEILWQQAIPEERPTLNRRLAEARTNWKQFIAELEQQYPAYHELKYQASTLTLVELQDWLKGEAKGKILIGYFWGQDSVWQLQISPEKVAFSHFPSTVDSIQAFTDRIRRPWQLQQDQQAWRRLGEQIRQTVLSDLSIPDQGLIILPDGILSRLPFGALPQPGSKTAQSQFLIEQCPIQYAYSATALVRSVRPRQSPLHQLLAIAPIRFPDLPTLALSEQEVADFAQIGDSKILLGDSANIVTLRQLIGDYEILHFSTHASSGQRENQYPWIALADGRWYLPQIYATPIKASLVVLSACESSEGTYQIGEGPMSLARGFQYAGAPSTIASLWQVNEATTTTLMQSFYRYLEAGLPQDQALQRAKVAFLAEAPAIQRSPYYWAAFVQVGRTDSPMGQPFSGWWVLLGLLVLGGVGVYFWLGKRPSSSPNPEP